MANGEQRRVLMEAEIGRLERELGVLEHQWGKRPRLFAFALAAIPAYFVFGKLSIFLVILLTLALFATQTYLLGVRRAECRQLISETQRELERLEKPSYR